MSRASDHRREMAIQLRAAILAVFVSGACITVAALALFGARTAAGTAVGALIATANLWVFSKVGQAFVARKGTTAWGTIAVLKLVFLFGGVAIILKGDYVSGVSLAAGYGAMPMGITLASLFGPQPRNEDDDEPG